MCISYIGYHVGYDVDAGGICCIHSYSNIYDIKYTAQGDHAVSLPNEKLKEEVLNK
jgi:hypothetical protein